MAEKHGRSRRYLELLTRLSRVLDLDTLSPLTILPGQTWLDRELVLWLPERELWLIVVLDAVADYLGTRAARQRAASKWFQAKDERPMSWRWAAAHFDLDPDVAFRALQKRRRTMLRAQAPVTMRRGGLRQVRGLALMLPMAATGGGR